MFMSYLGIIFLPQTKGFLKFQNLEVRDCKMSDIGLKSYYLGKEGKTLHCKPYAKGKDYNTNVELIAGQCACSESCQGINFLDK
jgi:hypothetical protein